MELHLKELRDPKKTPSDYVIRDIEPRNGNRLRYLHETVLGAPCYIINAKVGERGLLMCRPDYDFDTYHRLHTSTIEKVIESVGGNEVIIMTRNTNYILERSNFKDTFRGVQHLGDDLAYDLS